MKALLVFLLGSVMGLHDLQGQGGELVLKQGDRINISIGGVHSEDIPQIRGVYTIADDGTVPLLYIGNVRAAGLKPSGLQRSIEQTYIREEIYTKPTVIVSIDGGATAETMRYLMITGVNKPGTVPYSQDMTLSRAIMSAGGPTHFGNMKKVKLIRSGQPPSVHNLSSGTGDPGVDVKVMPNDQIIVPE